jgi:hypothetical protein
VRGQWKGGRRGAWREQIAARAGWKEGTRGAAGPPAALGRAADARRWDRGLFAFFALVLVEGGKIARLQPRSAK